MENAREKLMRGCARMVVKVGTRLLTDPEQIPALISGIAKLRAKGIQVLLVSSGAVGTGIKLLNLEKRPRHLADVQALAAIGQGKLMGHYSEACAACGFAAAQLLLTRDDLRERKRYLNVLKCIESLWNYGVLPIVNGNDPVSVDELKFSDNDILSGMLAAMTSSDLAVILTTESGLRRRVNGVLADRISVVEQLTPEIFGNAGGTDDSTFSVGGMASKLNAAELVTRSGGYLWIADGRDPEILDKISAGRDVGTLFLPVRKGRLRSRKLWIAAFSKVMGRIVVDPGAAAALVGKGSSLLASGMVQAQGDFEAGDTVEIVRADGMKIGHGIAAFSSEDCSKIYGLKAGEVKKLLGADSPEEVIHRDRLTLSVK